MWQVPCGILGEAAEKGQLVDLPDAVMTKPEVWNR